MDLDGTYNEMDTFAVEFLETVKAHKENFEKVTKEEEAIGSSKQIPQPSSVVNTAKAAESDQEQAAEEVTGKRPNINDRLRKFALQYQEQCEDEDYKENYEKATAESVDAGSVACSQPTTANTESSNEPAAYERPKLKDRLREVAMKFNVQNEDEEPVKAVEKIEQIIPAAKSVVVGVSEKVKSFEPVKPFAFLPKSNVNKPEQQKPSQKVFEAVAKETAPTKKTSVADLKKLFENNAPEKDPNVKAPELLSVREKAKLFEKKRLEEEMARKQQYYPTHSRPVHDKRAISPIEPMDDSIKRSKCLEDLRDDHQEQTVEETIEPTEMPDPTEDVEPDESCEPSAVEEEDQLNANENDECDDDSNEKDEFDQQVAMECVDKAFETITNIYETQMDADLTFTALDNDESTSKQFLATLSANKLYPFLTGEEEDGQFPRSSTRSDISDSAVSGLEISIAEPAPTTSDNQHSSVPEGQGEASEAPQVKTLSFYRRQQQIEKAKQRLPSEQENQVIYLRQQLPKEELNYESFIEGCNEKMNKQYARITNAKQIIKQASQALGLCLSMPEMIHSDARVEADRLLLESEFNLTLASSEIRRLKSMIQNPEKYYKKNPTKAVLSISNINLPLRHDFVVSRSKGKTQSVHHFSCLISYNSKMLCSKTISTEANMSSDLLEFPFGLVVNELEADFRVEIKLFDLELFKDEKPKKRGLNFAKSLRLKHSTASNSSGKSSKMGADSPAPSASNARTSFKEVAAISLTLDEVRKLPKYFTFTNLTSPLQGIMTMQLALEVNHQNYFEGFFDYQDIENRFWNLRWFVIDGPSLMYWRFKEDFATKKPTMGKINLKHCINPTVGFLKPEFRHLCSRPNTIVLVTMQPENVSNAAKLVTGGVIRKPTPQMHFISSASREEIIELSTSLNDVLNSLRAWETGRVVPKYSPEEFDRLMGAL